MDERMIEFRGGMKDGQRQVVESFTAGVRVVSDDHKSCAVYEITDELTADQNAWIAVYRWNASLTGQMARDFLDW